MICLNVPSMFGYYKGKPILRLALHCVMGPGSYDSFIFQKALRYFVICTGILGRKPVPCYKAWSLDLLYVKVKF